MGFKTTDETLKKIGFDEPIFVLRAQDNLAPTIVDFWAALAAAVGTSEAKVKEAQALAERMRRWPGLKKNPD